MSANFFSFLDVPVELGRSFAAEEEQPGKDRVVVISDALWRRRTRQTRPRSVARF